MSAFVHVRVLPYHWRADRQDIAFNVTCEKCPKFGVPLRYLASAISLGRKHFGDVHGKEA